MTTSNRTFPLRSILYPGQSLESYLEGLAAQHRVTVRELILDCGVRLPQAAQELSSDHPDATFRSLAVRTGVSEQSLRDATLARLAEMGLVRRQSGARTSVAQWDRWRLFARGAGSRFCACCLTESGGRWQLSWMHSWSFACLKHAALLCDTCHACGGAPRTGENRLSDVLDPWQCCHRRPGALGWARQQNLCNTDLRQSPFCGVDPDGALIRAQRRITAMVTDWSNDDSSTTELAGIHMPVRAGFAGIAGMMRLLTLGGTPTRDYVAHTLVPGQLICADLEEPKFRDASPIGVLAQLDSSASHFGVYAAIALDILSGPNLVRAAHSYERFDDLRARSGDPLEKSWQITRPPQSDSDETAPPKALEPARRFQTRVPSAVVEAIVITSRRHEFAISDHLSFRTANPLPRYPGAATHGFAIPAAGYSSNNEPKSVSTRHIPQCLWTSVTAGLPRHTHQDTATFAPAMAMALARAGTFTRWKIIALQLSIPADKLSGVRAVFAAQIKLGLIDRTLGVLDALMECLLADPPPIDYARRRWVFRELTKPGRNRLRRACRDSGLILTDRRRRFAGQMLWEILTGGDARLRPREYTFVNPGDRSAYARFRSEEGRDLQRFFGMEGERHLLSHRIDEPVTWEPTSWDGGGSWTSQTTPVARQLAGWDSSSRRTTMRKAARDHRARVWTQLVDDLHLNLDAVHDVLAQFGPAELCNLELGQESALPWPIDPTVLSDVRLDRTRTNHLMRLHRRQKMYETDDIVVDLGGGYWRLGGAGEVLRREFAHCWPEQPDAWNGVDPGVPSAHPQELRSDRHHPPTATGTYS